MEGKQKNNKKSSGSPSEQKTDKKKNSAKRRSNKKKKRASAAVTTNSNGQTDVTFDSDCNNKQVKVATSSILSCDIDSETNNDSTDNVRFNKRQQIAERKKSDSSTDGGNLIVSLTPRCTVTGTVSESVISKINGLTINNRTNGKKIKKSSSSGALVMKKTFKPVSKSKSTTSSIGSENKLKSDSKTEISRVVNNESLRWENQTADPAEEESRLNVYKMNRRKRYLAERQRLGLDCSVNNSGSSSYAGSSSDSLPNDSLVPTFAMGPLHTNRADIDIRVNCA